LFPVRIELISLQDLEKGDTITLRDGEIAQVTNAVQSESGAVLLTLYLQDEVRRAVVQSNAKLRRVIEGTLHQ
jgi:hypothetical protein